MLGCECGILLIYIICVYFVFCFCVLMMRFVKSSRTSRVYTSSGDSSFLFFVLNFDLSLFKICKYFFFFCVFV